MSTFDALGVRNFRLYFGAQIGSNVGTWFQTLALSLLVLDLTSSGLALGVIPALQWGPILLFAGPAGVLADRVNPRRILAVANTASGAIAAGLGVASLGEPVGIGVIYASTAVLGSVQAFERTTAQVFLLEMTGPEDLQSAIGLNTVIQSSARLAGPAMGGLVYAAFGPAPCFLLNGASFGLVVLALALMRPSELFPRERLQGQRRVVRAALRYAKGHPELWPLLAVNVVIGLLAFNFLTTVTGMVRFAFDAGAGPVGWAHSANAGGSVLGGLVAGGLHRPSRRTVALAATLMGLAVLVNAAAPTLTVFLLWAPVFGLAVTFYQGTLQGAVQHSTDPAMLGRVMSFVTLGSFGTTPFGNLLVGWLIDAWSPRAGMAVGGVAALACAAALSRPGQGRRDVHSAA